MTQTLPEPQLSVSLRELLRTTYSTADFPTYYETEDDSVDWADIIISKGTNTWHTDWDSLHPDDLDYRFCVLIESMMEHGMTHGVAWKSGYLYNGHHRVIAAILLGWDEIPLDYYGDWEDREWPEGSEYIPPDYINPRC